MGDYQYIQASIEDQITLLVINHPPANALSRETLRELEAACDAAIADLQVRAIIITGAGKLFSAGADLGEIKELRSYEEARELAERGQRLLNKIEAASKPVIAAINGRFALGGGAELALACHFRVAEEGVRLGQPEVTLGLMPGWGGTQRLPRLIGKGRALEMLLSGGHLSAEEAQRIGLVNKVVPAGTAVQEAKQMAKAIAQFGTKAIAAILDAVNAGPEMPLREGLRSEAEQFARLCQSEDMREGVNAFLEKRRPRFTGR